MSAKGAKGAKRKCQNDECAAPFYDLGRAEFNCPVCGTVFDHEAAAKALEPQTAGYPSRKQPRELRIVPTAEPGESDEATTLDETDDDVNDESETASSEEAPEGLLETEDDDDNLADSIEVPKPNENDET